MSGFDRRGHISDIFPFLGMCIMFMFMSCAWHVHVVCGMCMSHGCGHPIGALLVLITASSSTCCCVPHTVQPARRCVCHTHTYTDTYTHMVEGSRLSDVRALCRCRGRRALHRQKSDSQRKISFSE